MVVFLFFSFFFFFSFAFPENVIWTGGLHVYHSKKCLYCMCIHKALCVLHNMNPRGAYCVPNTQDKIQNAASFDK